MGYVTGVAQPDAEMASDKTATKAERGIIRMMTSVVEVEAEGMAR